MGKNERMRRLYANHLGREERVLASVRGTVETGRGEPWTGLLLATDRRLAFIADDEASYLPYSAIERVGRGKSLLGGYIALSTGGHEVRIKWINPRRDEAVRAYATHGVRQGKLRRPPLAHTPRLLSERARCPSGDGPGAGRTTRGLALDQPPDEQHEQDDHEYADEAIASAGKSERECCGGHEGSLVGGPLGERAHKPLPT